MGTPDIGPGIRPLRVYELRIFMPTTPYKSRILLDLACGIGVMFITLHAFLLGIATDTFSGYRGDLIIYLMAGDAIVFLVSVFKKMWITLIASALLIYYYYCALHFG
jgi:hypothetical protein